MMKKKEKDIFRGFWLASAAAEAPLDPWSETGALSLCIFHKNGIRLGVADISNAFFMK